jgi:hypothetical protein
MANSNMDPFDEFEFKPLTDGLGFHKKSVSLKDGLHESGVLQDELQSIPTTAPRGVRDDIPKAPTKKHSFDDVLSALEKTPLNRPSDLTFTEPLPREPKPVQSPFPNPAAFKGPANPGKEKIFPTPAAHQVKKTPTQADLNSVGTRRGAADSPRRNLMPATMSVASAVLDLMIVSALALVFLVALLTVTKVDLNAVIATTQRDFMTQISLGVLFLAVMQMYVIISRSFFGATLGEWTFDLQVGQDEEQKKESYPFKVIFRSLLNIITGIVLLPLVSALIGRDIAGQLSGIKLYRQRT